MTLGIKPLNGDILMKRCNDPTNSYESGTSSIMVKRRNDEEYPWFEVVAVSDNLTSGIQVGDKVMVTIGRYTPPFLWENELLVSTHEREAILVWSPEDSE